MKRYLPILALLAAVLLTSTASAHEPFPLATAFFRARANVAALRVARLQSFRAPVVKQQVVVQKQVVQVVQPAYVAPVVQYQVAPVVQYQAVQAYVAPVQVQKVQVQAVGGCAAFFSY